MLARAADGCAPGHRPADVLDSRPRRHRRPDDRARRRRAASARGRRRSTRAARAGIGLVAWSDAAYPPALPHIVDPPPVLWTRGAAAALARAGRRDRRIARRVAVRARGGRAARRAISRRAAGRRERPGARRRFGGAPRRACGGRRHRRRARIAAPTSMYPAEHARARRARSRAAAPIVSELVPGTAPLPDVLSACATGSSAACRARSS